ncbi:uncharacterized protein EAF02_006193 [Botrytis sinoallii]|uniref:uncharacterized protein n=1 Tax=Botrytis sinoallii TaxID=1463999 RepID=UPI00190281C5|nr:uncharacterized protein EAF02_006193 [Botrytis sinoallii]KAF7882830.1 hypothetical protein EAF02_006193 [Botrytis sinoallii]
MPSFDEACFKFPDKTPVAQMTIAQCNEEKAKNTKQIARLTSNLTNQPPALDNVTDPNVLLRAKIDELKAREKELDNRITTANKWSDAVFGGNAGA